VRLAREGRDLASVARALQFRASFLPCVGEGEAAAADIAEGLALFRKLEDPMGIGDMLRIRAWSNSEQESEFAANLRDLEENLSIRRCIRDRPGLGMALTDLGMQLLAAGDQEQARGHLEESLAVYQASGWGNSSGVGDSLRGLAQIARDQHRREDAWLLEHRALEIHLPTRYFGRAARCLLVLVELAVERGDPARAARLLGATERLPPADVLHELTQQLSATVIALLSPEAWEREVATGRALSDAELLQLTASGLPPP
jgi:tetratricopeptide (TPR) repeat protein